MSDVAIAPRIERPALLQRLTTLLPVLLVPAAGRGGLGCAHCGFASAHERAFYCPKCGMRLLRG